MLSFYGLALLALNGNSLNVPKVDPGPLCWFQHVCLSEGDNKLDEVRDKLKTPMECYNECSKMTACKFFTFRELNSHTVCELLTRCNNEGQCSDDQKCKSGPNDCSLVNPCPMIAYTEGSAIWSCDGTVDPYKNQVPHGYTCHTSCGGWKSADGTETVKASSMCENGSWGQVDLQPASNAVVNRPDQMTDCTCPEFKLWYNPNREPGASFHCSATDFSDASPGNIKLIDPSEDCVLMCDNYLAAKIACQNGAWLEADPDLGIACYRAPPTLSGEPTATDVPTTSPSVLHLQYLKKRS